MTHGITTMAQFSEEYIDCSLFSHREDGKIPCLAVGDDSVYDVDDCDGEITGICFQKVDTGCVKPVLDDSLFSKVHWPNAPTRIKQQNWRADFHLIPQVFTPEENWTKFGNLMSHLRQALITQMTPPNGQPPESLLEGLHSNFWLGGADNDRKKTPIETQMQTLIQMIGQHWVEEKVYVQWVQCVVEGFVGGRQKVGNLLDHLLKIYETAGIAIEEPPGSAINGSIRNGVVHCLTFGSPREQVNETTEDTACDTRIRNCSRQRQQGNPQERGRFRQRILLPKRAGSNSRSRSRSPSPTDNITRRIINVRNHRNTSERDMLQNPEDFEVHPNWLHSYFESHTPDLLIYSSRPNSIVVKAEIVVQISAFDKYPSSVEFSSYLSYCTLKNVQQCLASLSVCQEEVLGLVIVPDGLKLIKVKKEKSRDKKALYKVQETDIVRWHETHSIYLLLKEIETMIQKTGQ